MPDALPEAQVEGCGEALLSFLGEGRVLSERRGEGEALALTNLLAKTLGLGEGVKLRGLGEGVKLLSWLAETVSPEEVGWVEKVALAVGETEVLLEGLVGRRTRHTCSA